MTKAEKTRRERKEKYENELLPMLEHMDDAQRKAVLRNLIDKIANLTATVYEIEDETLKRGVTVKYNNGGGQEGTRIHPAVQVYSQYGKLLHANLRQFRDFLPEESGEPDELKAFIASHDKK